MRPRDIGALMEGAQSWFEKKKGLMPSLEEYRKLIAEGKNPHA